MKGQLPVTTPDQYLARLEEPRRTEVARLDAVIRETLPGLERCIVSGMLAYGPVHYRYASGREGDSARVSVASNVGAISLYALAADDRGWLAERYRARLPRAKIGKACVRFKRLEDLDLEALRALLRDVEVIPFPGHGGQSTSEAPAKRPGPRTRPRTRPSKRRR